MKSDSDLGSRNSRKYQSPKIPTIIMMVRSSKGLGKNNFAGKCSQQIGQGRECRPFDDCGPISIVQQPSRPVARDPWSNRSNVPVFSLGTEVPAVEIVRQGLGQRANHNDYVLIVTAGRLPKSMKNSWVNCRRPKPLL